MKLREKTKNIWYGVVVVCAIVVALILGMISGIFLLTALIVVIVVTLGVKTGVLPTKLPLFACLTEKKIFIAIFIVVGLAFYKVPMLEFGDGETLVPLLLWYLVSLPTIIFILPIFGIFAIFSAHFILTLIIAKTIFKIYLKFGDKEVGNIKPEKIKN